MHSYVVKSFKWVIIGTRVGDKHNQRRRKYFEDITNHKKNFVWVDDQDGSHIELTFSKKQIADRKQWFTNFQVSSHLLHPKL